MQLLRNLPDLPSEFRGGAVSIGNFDGVHRGHVRILQRLKEMAAEVGGPSVVFTFDPHPVRLLRPAAAPPPLTWTDRKAQLLAEVGIDVMIAYPTDEALLRLSAEEFFRQVVVSQLDARGMVEGPNFFFGRNRSGTIPVLAELCQTRGVRLEVVEPLLEEGEYISSSRVRNLIAAGEVATAARLLTRPYRIRGMVTHGAARGGRIGFPTANLEAIDTLLPAAGVYAARGEVEGRLWPAAVNIGANPTFGEQALKIEVHLIGYSGNLYGSPLEVEFVRRLRDTRPFASLEELKTQLALDVADAEEACRGEDSRP